MSFQLIKYHIIILTVTVIYNTDFLEISVISYFEVYYNCLIFYKLRGFVVKSLFWVSRSF